MESPYVIQDPKSWKGRWSDVFGNDNPIHVEIGMGKGRFITTLALENPDINYVGIEKYSSVLIRALEKREKIEVSNLVFIRMDAEDLTDVFGYHEVSRIYLNFSDPWPKDRHAKRRLTSQEYFGRYNQVLKNEGTVEFKTDNRDLFLFSLESVETSGWNLVLSTADLHHSIYCADNVMTEYEERFSSQGNPIYKMVADRQPAASVNTGESVI